MKKLLLSAVLVSAITFTSCREEDKNNAEQAGDAIENAAEETGEAVEDGLFTKTTYT